MHKLRILPLLLVLGLNCTFAAPVLLDKTVVIVNDNVITQSEINQAMAVAKQQLQGSNTPLPPEKELQQQVVNNLINQEIMHQMVKNIGIKISDNELNKAIANIAQSNKMTLQQLKQQIEASGLSYAQYKKQIREQMAIARLQQAEVGQDIKVTDQEVNAFLQKYKHVRNPNAQYHLEDILVPTPDNPSPQQIQQAKQQAEKLIREINQGKSFRELAAAQSGGSQALQGGDLGWRHLAEMPTIFADKVKDMQVGQIAGPLQAPNGFHVIKLTGIRDSQQRLTKNQVQELIYRRKFEEKLQIWLQQAREEAYVKFV